MTDYGDVLPAGDLGTFRGGSGFPIKFQGQASGDLPFFKVSDMSKPGNELFLRQANNYVSEAQRLAIGAVKIPAESIVFAKVGAAIFLERKRILVEDSCIDNNMAAFIVDKKRLDVRFAHYLLSAFKMGNLVATTALPSINSQQLSSIPLLVPKDIRIQREIASVLENMDDQIATLKHLIAKKQSVKQGMRQQLLTGRTRLPGFGGLWRQKEIGSIVNQHRHTVDPRRQPRREFQHFSLPAFDNNEKPVIEFGASIASIKFSIPENAVLVSKLNPRITRVWSPKYIGDNAVASTEFVVMTPRVGMSRSFIKWLMRSEKVTSRMRFLATGTTGSHSRISPRQIATLQVAIPDEKEQTEIAAVLDDAEAEIDLLRGRLQKARDVKAGMMQQLLTGRVRLPMEVTV